MRPRLMRAPPRRRTGPLADLELVACTFSKSHATARALITCEIAHLAAHHPAVLRRGLARVESKGSVSGATRHVAAADHH
ncbi:MAG: hypothetical protein OZ921_00600 [Sorangiineae bacterium]|nr:hypothetical protein [Sorangiineae bacterium]